MSIHKSKARVHLAALGVLALFAAVCASLVHAAKPQPPAPPVQYTMIHVPGMSTVTGMNKFGDMVDGGASLFEYASNGGTVYDVAAPIQSCLDTLGFGVFQGVMDINDTWQVAGVFMGTDGRSHVFRCSLAKSSGGAIVADDFEELLQDPDFPWGLSFAINNRGDVVGELEADAPPPNHQWRAFLWSADGTVDMFLPDRFSAARDVSDPDQYGVVWVTGFMYGPWQQHAFLYTPGSPVQDLNTLSRRNISFGYAVNSRGQVAGRAYDPRPEVAFRYTSGVGSVALGTLANDSYSSGRGINASGYVVGTSTSAIGITTVSRGFLYTDKMLDLGTLIVNPTGLDLATFRPERINDFSSFGQIAGGASVNGVWGVVLLTPNR